MFSLFRTSLVLLLIAVPMRFGAASSPSEIDAVRTIPLRWRDSKMTLAVSRSFEASTQNIKPGTDVMAVIRRSADTWSAATGIQFVIVTTDAENVSRSGPVGDGINLITSAPTEANARVFASNSVDAPATTRLFFGRQGYISEADIVLNTSQHFSDDGTFGTFDLESIVTHEIGHLLGLEHSPIPGSVMYPQHAKNGLYAASVSWGRSLHEPDLAAARAIYGTTDPERACCYRIEGSLPAIGAKRNAIVWVEEERTGIVAASRTVPYGSAFSFDGLEQGSYRVFHRSSENLTDARNGFRSVSISLSSQDPVAQIGNLPMIERNSVSLDQVGLNGQLSRTAAALEAGGRYTLYLAGKGMVAGKVIVESSSRLLTFEPESIRSHDYGAQVAVISVEVSINAETPPGSYSVAIVDSRGDRSILPGAIVVVAR